MYAIPSQFQWLNKWIVFSAVSLAFFFLNLSTFTSLGVVLFSMVNDLHWSMTAAGFCFTLLGLACGLSSPLPTLTMRWFGTRATVCLGALLLLAGFALASVAESLLVFYAAMILLGIGYSLAGNVPGICLIANWFTCNSARTIGLYMMLGALGAAFGPPIVEAIASGQAGWRGCWQVMAVASAVIGVICLVSVREPKSSDVTFAEVCPEGCNHDGPACARRPAQESPGWTSRQAIFTSQFALVAAAMAATMAGVTTNSSILVSHLAKLGTPAATGAIMLSVIAITATLVKGVAGRVCERLSPPHILAAGLALQGVGSLAFAFADTGLLQYASAASFGAGWGLAYVAGTVILLDYFGPQTGSRILSIVWLLTTVAAAGPLAAGIIADRFGTFAPMFDAYAAMFLLLAAPVFVMRAPARRDGSMVGSAALRGAGQ